MNLIDLSIRRPVFAWVLMFSMIVFGAICMSRLGISQMPDVDFPILNVTVTYEGAAPEIVEADLIEPIETRLLNIDGVKEMRAIAAQGVASVTLEFDINRDVNVALQEVQSALSQLKLPPGVDPAIIKKSNPEEDPIMFIAISGGDSVKDMIQWSTTFLTDQLQFIPGVGEVALAGFPDRNIRVWLDPEKLSKNDFTVNDVVDALKAQHLESSAGQFVSGKVELRVRWLGEAVSPAEIGDIQILKRGSLVLNNNFIFKVKDLATVEDGLSDVRRIARVDGKPAIAVTLKKQRGTNEVTIAEAVEKKLEELKPNFPKGYRSEVVVNFTKATRATVDLTKEKLVVAAFITILVCFCFLGSIQAALNILISLPTSIVGAFTVLYFAKFTLNLFTLLALTLAISIVVDDAIMLLENIVRHYRMGKGADRAASDGSKEVLPAAIAATLAVIAVFLPVVFMTGIVGKFFFQFGITMSAAVLLSLLEAVTITPMRAAAFFAHEPKISKLEHKLDVIFEEYGRTYGKWLAKTLKWKTTVVFGSIGLFLLSMLLVTKVRQEFVPLQDQDLVIVSAITPPGSTLDVTNQIALQIEEIIKAQPEVLRSLISIGGSGGGAVANVNQVFIPITLVPRDQRKVSHVEFMGRLRPLFSKLKGVVISMRDMSARSLSTGRANPVAFNLRGPNLEILSSKVVEIMGRLKSEGLAVDLDTDYRKGIPELVVAPDRKAMGLRGVNVDTVSQLLAVAVGGLRQGQFTADGKRYDIRFKIPESMIQSPKDIENLYVRNNFGNRVAMRDIVKTNVRETSQSITRINRQRSMSVFGNLAPGKSQSAVLERAKEISREILPPGYSFALEGASAGFSEAFKSLLSAMMIGILVAYLILAVQFDSFIHPISILIALPFSVTGAMLTLWATGTSLNLFSFIGLIVLMGIAKKNSIMLVEFTNHIRKEKGTNAEISLLEACPIRLRPILMTSIATVAAAGPLVFGHGIGSETRLPMGLAIIGGTIVSTALTLFVVPALYLVLVKYEKPKRSTLGLEPSRPRDYSAELVQNH